MMYFTFIKGHLVQIDEDNGLMRYLVDDKAPTGKFTTIWQVYDFLDEREEYARWIPWERNGVAIKI